MTWSDARASDERNPALEQKHSPKVSALLVTLTSRFHPQHLLPLSVCSRQRETASSFKRFIRSKLSMSYQDIVSYRFRFVSFRRKRIFIFTQRWSSGDFAFASPPRNENDSHTFRLSWAEPFENTRSTARTSTCSNRESVTRTVTRTFMVWLRRGMLGE